jgi:hypothetical protein
LRAHAGEDVPGIVERRFLNTLRRYSVTKTKCTCIAKTPCRPRR